MPRFRKAKSRSPVFEISINVLGYPEGDEWVALALEMDLRGYGKTFAEAFRELDALVDNQIGFALSKGQPEMIFFPAERTYFELFSKVIAAHLAEFEPEEEKPAYEIASLKFPDPHVIEKMKSGFTSGHGKPS